MFKTTRSSAAIILAAGLFAAGSAPGSEPAAAKRLAVPAADAVAKSRGTIRAAYESDYKTAKQSGEYAGLLEKLRASATTEPDPSRKYAFLLEAEEVTTEHDDVAATLATIDRRAELFEIDGLDERAKTLARLATPRVAPDLALFEQARDTATRAATAERFDIATNSAKLALDVARAIDRAQKAAARPRQFRRPAPGEAVPTANGGDLIKSANETQARILRHKKLFDEYQQAKTTLATTPDDAAANAKAGTYLCLVARKWDQGLPHLKKSDHATLGDLAAEELALGDPASADTAKLFSLAGNWWDAAEAKALSEDERLAVRDHASRLYATVRPKLIDPLEILAADTRGGKGADAVTAPNQVVNSIGVKFTLIPAGSFKMGSNDGNADEKPVHEVQITKPFYLGVYELTNKQWKAVMGDVPSQWQDDNKPVEQVSWDDAMTFCKKLSALPEEKAAGREYRLPTEAEWEYACRAETSTRFLFGDDDANLDDFGWFKGNAGGKTHLVGQKRPNAWGLHDMAGNVWEWCSDKFGQYGNGATTDPRGPSEGSVRVCRGGAWDSPARDCRTAVRWPGPSLRTHNRGFRLAISLPGKSSSAKPDIQAPPDAVVRDETGTAYKVFKESLSWHDAKKRCEDLGGHLVVITSPEENQFVSSLLARTGGGTYWAGASDEAKEGTWTWVDGSEMGFSAWGGVEPNNQDGVENYLGVIAPHALWNDAVANWHEIAGFICEWEKADDDPSDRRVFARADGRAFFVYNPARQMWREEPLFGESIFEFAEMKRTPEYVQALDKGRGMTIRVHQDRVDWITPDRKDWIPLWNGKWISANDLASMRLAERTVWMSADKQSFLVYRPLQKEWREEGLVPDQGKSFAEKDRTPDFVEVHDPGRQMSLRIYGDKVQSKAASDTEWKVTRFGQWIEREKLDELRKAQSP